MSLSRYPTPEDAISAHGFNPPDEILWDGDIHRFPTDARRSGKKDGWYVAYSDDKGQVCVFASWRDAHNKVTWSSGLNGHARHLSAAELALIDEKRRAKLAEWEKRRADAAKTATHIYAAAKPTGISAYLNRKGIALPEGVRFASNLQSQPVGFEKPFLINGLVVPVMTSTGAICSVQFIPDAADAHKYFLPGGATKGGFFPIGNLKGAPIIGLAEGLATAQSGVEATGWPVVVAFSAGNLPTVAKTLRQHYPQAELVVLGDFDEAGQKYGAEAAAVAQGRAVFPPDGINDFNDLHQARGIDAVRAALQPEPTDPLWRTQLISREKEDGTHDVLCRVHNLILILENAPEWRGRLALNAFTQTVTDSGREWLDASVFELKSWLEKNWIYGEVKTNVIHEAVEVVARRHTYHPVMNYLNGLRWDGAERLGTFFTDYCGSAMTPYTHAVARSLFVSAVARIFQPGSKVDTMVVLEGSQGAGKSRLVLALFTPDFHMEITEAPGSVDFYQSLRGRWCCEFGEMAAFGKSDKNRIKQVITQTQDTYRASYARNTRTWPRQTVFIGTTNRDDWGDDETGLRRFLPIHCPAPIDVDGVHAVRDQLWAEAVVRFHRGETWWNIPDAEREQDARFQQDAWEERIASWLQSRSRVTVLDVLEECLQLKADRQGKSEQIRVGNILRRLKWRRKQDSTGDRRRYFVRKDE